MLTDLISKKPKINFVKDGTELWSFPDWMYPEKHKSFIDQVEKGDYSGSTGSDTDPEKKSSCVKGPVQFL